MDTGSDVVTLMEKIVYYTDIHMHVIPGVDDGAGNIDVALSMIKLYDNPQTIVESTSLIILQSVVQNPYTNAAGISMTQYSAIYNNEKKTVEVWPFQNYSKSFKFDVEGNRISADQ